MELLKELNELIYVRPLEHCYTKSKPFHICLTRRTVVLLLVEFSVSLRFLAAYVTYHLSPVWWSFIIVSGTIVPLCVFPIHVSQSCPHIFLREGVVNNHV